MVSLLPIGNIDEVQSWQVLVRNRFFYLECYLLFFEQEMSLRVGHILFERCEKGKSGDWGCLIS